MPKIRFRLRNAPFLPDKNSPFSGHRIAGPPERPPSVFPFSGRKLTKHVHWCFQHSLTSFFSHAKTPSVHVRTEGVKNAVPPLIQHCLTVNALQASNNALRDIGRTRPALLIFRQTTPGGISADFSHCLAPAGSSLAENEALTSSHHCVTGVILTKNQILVKEKNKISPTQHFLGTFQRGLRNVRTAMIRASSRFLPSRSRGVTEV